MVLQVDISGVERVNSLLRQVINLDITEALDQAGAIILNRIRTRFLKEEDTDGNKWPKSQASINRQRTGRGGGTLFDTGALFNSIQLSRVSRFERSIGTDVPYAKQHQEGIGVDKREFLGFNSDDINIIVRLLEKRVADRLR